MTVRLSSAQLIVMALAATLIGFSGGLASTRAFADPPDPAPIIDPDAWNRAALAHAAGLPPPLEPRCNPWEISDVAMEDVLDQMIRRGWRPPRQGAAVARLDVQPGEVSAIDPDAPMPSRRAGSASAAESQPEDAGAEEADAKAQSDR